MPSVYVGSSLLNANQASEVMQRFRDAGVDITYDWTPLVGQKFSDEQLGKYGIEEINGVKNADLFFMLSPARHGTHVELGIALASGKPVVMVDDPHAEKKTFYFVPNVFRFSSLDAAFVFTMTCLKITDRLMEKFNDI